MYRRELYNVLSFGREIINRFIVQIAQRICRHLTQAKIGLRRPSPAQQIRGGGCLPQRFLRKVRQQIAVFFSERKTGGVFREKNFLKKKKRFVLVTILSKSNFEIEYGTVIFFLFNQKQKRKVRQHLS